MKKLIVAWSFFLLLLLLYGCGDSSSSNMVDTDASGAIDTDTNRAPVAMIITPKDGSSVAIWDFIEISGVGIDAEDGELGFEWMTWVYDGMDHMSTENSIVIQGGWKGAKEVVLTVMDSGGAVGTDSIEILTAVLPDTGQTDSYTDVPGEDSDYLINPQYFSKLDASGVELETSATDWSMVKDNWTGLTWEVKTDDGGDHDRDTTYTWSEAQSFIDTLNSEKYGGFSDWRRPTIMELATLVDSDSMVPAISTQFFPNTLTSSGFWSDTPLVSSTDEAWAMDFGFGFQASTPKTEAHYVRAVRGEVLETNDLVDNGDDTVTDLATGLMWQQYEHSFRTWEEALSYCENLELAGYDDWRLPNRNELQSITDYAAHEPAIDTFFFPTAGLTLPLYWSSTTFVMETDKAWIMVLDDGLIPVTDKSSEINVRAVRGGTDGY